MYKERAVHSGIIRETVGVIGRLASTPQSGQGLGVHVIVLDTKDPGLTTAFMADIIVETVLTLGSTCITMHCVYSIRGRADNLDRVSRLRDMRHIMRSDMTIDFPVVF